MSLPSLFNMRDEWLYCEFFSSVLLENESEDGVQVDTWRQRNILALVTQMKTWARLVVKELQGGEGLERFGSDS